MGVEASSELKSLMQQQLANGQATALAHLILANQEIKAGRMADAIPHLELTVKAAPEHPVALNNLALALALTDSANAKRAEELIDQAVKIDGRNPELFDSQGQIRLIAGRPLDAVDSLEKAIGIDPNRVGTRELVVKAYREAGLEDLAVQQERALTKLKADLAKAQAESLKANDKSATKAPNKTEPAPVAKPVEKSPEKSPAEKSSATPSDKPTPNKPQTNKPPTEKAASDKAPTDKAPTDKAPTDKAPTDKPVEKTPAPLSPELGIQLNTSGKSWSNTCISAGSCT